MRIILLLASLFFCLGTTSAQGPAKDEFNSIARLLAALPQESENSLCALYQTKAVKKYLADSAPVWKNAEKKIAAIKKWEEQNDKDVFFAQRPLFYPFSGPDILYPLVMFPDSSKYLLVGLEPVGQILTNDDLALNPKIFFRNMVEATHYFLYLSFFRTNDMAVDFSPKTLGGTTTILLPFIARLGGIINDITLMELSDRGELVPAGAVGEKKKAIYGVRIWFTKATTGERSEVVYLQVDLLNENLKKHPEFAAFVRGYCKKESNSLLKAASYLMHRETFSAIRSLILEESAVVVQDDSGIPLRFFADRDNHPYGVYSRPIPLFKNRKQKDLLKFYRANKAPNPLPFSFGYQWRVGESNLLVAKRRMGN
ncbi:MAG TPA: hypothetical protein VF451_02395 [Acidobacteriota bacterium]